MPAELNVESISGEDHISGQRSQGNQTLTRVTNEPVGSSSSAVEQQAFLPPLRRPGRPRINPLVYGPKRNRGRPRKGPNQGAGQQPVKKKACKRPSPSRMRVSGTRPSTTTSTPSRSDTSHYEPASTQRQSDIQQLAQSSDVQPASHSAACQSPLHHTVIEDEDPSHEIDDHDDDVEVDGAGIGMDDEVYGEDGVEDEDDDTDDNGEVNPEQIEERARTSSHPTKRPLPPWLIEPFNAAVNESKQRDNYGLPPLYQKSTFWFPTPAPYFILRSAPRVSPQTLYNPRLFLWDPQALYKIPCPRCKKPLNRHQHIPRPRRCVDLNTTFWIIGYRYRCRHCTNPRTGHRTVTYRSWDPRIMESLPAELAAEFPACLSYRSGMSKQLFELMRSTFQNGLGSGQFADLLRIQHLLAYDNLHLQYLNHLITRRESLDAWMGASYTPFLPFDNISPQGRHGYTPSSTWLRDIYDSYIEAHQKEFNQHMSMLTGEICAIDHSHKVTKHVARVEGEQVFTALLTVTNEKGEIRICNFVATKSHSQFEDALSRMRSSLNLYGHRQPLLFYTDNMADKHLLETSFPSLRDNVTPLEKYAHYNPLEFTSDIKVFCKDSVQSINDTMLTILNDVPDDGGEIVVGFDVEWNVELSPQGFVRSSGKAAIAQVAYKNRIYILQLSEILSQNKLPHQLELFLSHPHVRKVGRLVAGDLSNLQKASHKPPGSFSGALDLAKVAKDRYVIPNATNVGLADLAAIVLQKRLDKNTSLRTSYSWENKVLSNEQISYAAMDAYASLLIYHELVNTYTIPSPLLTSTPPSMPILLYTPNMQSVIAEGVLLPCTRFSTCNGVKVSPLHIIINVQRVLVPGALVSSHHNRSLESFGNPPFPLVCLRDHIRTYTPTQSQTRVINSMPLKQSSNIQISTSESSESTEELDDELISIGDALRSDMSGPAKEIPPSSNHVEVLESVNNYLGPDELLGLAKSPTEWDNLIHSRVLNDVWHIFHRIYISATHGLRKQFTRELRDAIFIADKEDRDRIDAWGSTQNPQESYSKLRNTSPEWTRKRCRHTIPPPHILYPLVRKVFCVYGPLRDPKTKQPLFSSKTQWHMARNILDLIRKGFVSDPPGIPLYTQIGIDKKTGLPIYRCIRGTNATEGGVHTHIRARLPKFGVSIRHVQASLLDFTLRHNLLVGTLNTTGHRYRSHFSIWTINHIQELLLKLKDVFSSRVQLDGWINGNMYIPTSEVIGILPIPDDVRSASAMAPFHPSTDKKKRFSFMAAMQNTRKAVLPIHTSGERELFRHLMETENTFSPKSGEPKWNDAVVIWNEHAENKADIYYKLVEHLKTHYSKWKTLLNVKEALSLTSDVRQPLSKLIHNPSRASIAPSVPTMELRKHQVAQGQRDMTAITETSEFSQAKTPEHLFPDSIIHRSLSISQPVQHVKSITALKHARQLPHPRAPAVNIQHQQVPQHTEDRSSNARRKRTCRKCASPDCKGKRAVKDCQNKCRDCGVVECQGRNSHRPHLSCRDGWD